MVIECKRVTKKLRKAIVLQNVNLRLESGRVYGLWGSNGSGKTMLLRVLAGLIYPTSGTVKLDGKKLGKDLDFPESIGLLLENPAFLDDYAGLRNLELIAALNHKISTEEIRTALRDVGLTPDDKRPYRKYSLGMKQRLGLAAAFMEHPQLLLLDEPTNALDEAGFPMLEDLIIREKDRGALIVVASHDRNFLELVSDEIYRVSEGQISAEEAP